MNTNEHVSEGQKVLFRRPDGETVTANCTKVWESTFHQTDPMPTINLSHGEGEAASSVPHRSMTTSPGYYWQHI